MVVYHVQGSHELPSARAFPIRDLRVSRGSAYCGETPTNGGATAAPDELNPPPPTSGTGCVFPHTVTKQTTTALGVSLKMAGHT